MKTNCLKAFLSEILNILLWKNYITTKNGHVMHAMVGM